ncbi:MAG: hypothetical protein K2X29_12415 [Candidatus Obscuribacterales bacterium]|nr:hypothetical protein [Candidatus Obscuribacterales bacterium]
MRLTPLLFIAAGLSLFCGTASLAQEDTDSNSPSPEVVRKVMGDDMPDFKSIWALPSLTDEQRDEIKSLMLANEQEAKPLKDELNSIQESVLGGGQLSPEQMREASQYIMSGGAMPSTSGSESKVLNRVNELKDQLKEKSNQLWQQIKNVLTVEQISQVQNF